MKYLRLDVKQPTTIIEFHGAACEPEIKRSCQSFVFKVPVKIKNNITSAFSIYFWEYLSVSILKLCERILYLQSLACIT